MYNDRAVEILNTHDKSKPFFMYYAAQTPHTDHKFNCPEKYSNLYSHIKDEKRRQILGLVTILDESIGHLVKALEDSGLLDDTLIYFMSDVGCLNIGHFGALYWLVFFDVLEWWRS